MEMKKVYRFISVVLDVLSALMLIWIAVTGVKFVLDMASARVAVGTVICGSYMYWILRFASRLFEEVAT